MSDPTPGRWAVVCHGPGETAVAVQIIAAPRTGATGIFLERSPYRVHKSSVLTTFADELAAHDYATGVNAANARHMAGMEKARAAANQAWNADVARLLV